MFLFFEGFQPQIVYIVLILFEAFLPVKGESYS